MSDSVVSALKVIGAIAAFLVILFVGWSILNSSRQKASNLANEADKDTTQMQETRYTAYDGATVTGSEVLSAIERFKDDKICIKVQLGAGEDETAAAARTTPLGGAGYVYTDEKLTTKDTQYDQHLREAKNISNKTKYINPSTSFYGYVTRDTDTGAITCVNFVKLK